MILVLTIIMIYITNLSSKNIMLSVLGLFGMLYLFSNIPGYHHSSHGGHSGHVGYSSHNSHLFNKKIIGTSIVMDYMIFYNFENAVEKNFQLNDNQDYMIYEFYYYINDYQFIYSETHDKYYECIYFKTYKNNNNNTVFNFENMIITNDYNTSNLNKYKYNCYIYTKIVSFSESLFIDIILIFIFISLLIICFDCCCRF